MRSLLRRFALAVLRSELTEREAAARRLAEGAYRGDDAPGGKQGGKRGRIWWDGHAAAYHALLTAQGNEL